MGFEVLEHTADVGVRARGRTLEEAFEQATWGFAEIAGIATEGRAEDVREVEIVLEGDDREALLVDWLSEVLWLHDAGDALVAGVTVSSVDVGGVRGKLVLVPRADFEVEGTQVKAVTYHRLRVEQRAEGWIVEVYLDV